MYMFYRYDQIMLAPFLLSSPALCNLSPRVSRNGSAVNVISFSNGIRFLDFSKLLSPGVSLSKFAECVGLKTTKCLLPYSLLDDGNVFLQKTCLPTDPEMYRSELTGNVPTVSEVQQAVEDFNNNKCKNINDYLKMYLTKDVLLLHVGLHHYIERLQEITNVHVVECDKYTLPSFADYCGQQSLMKNKYLGEFVCNHSGMFSLIRRASIGGYSAVHRTACGVGTGGGSPINNHLSNEKESAMEMDANERERAREFPSYITYMDINSLYPTSGT